MLTDTAIRKAKPGIKPGGTASGKPYKLADGGGLDLGLLPAGGRYWRWKYRYAGREKRLALGVYQQVSRRGARGRRDEARALLARGIDPSAHKKAARQERVSRAASSPRRWRASGMRDTRRHGRRATPSGCCAAWSATYSPGSAPAPELLAVLRRIEASGALETAHRCLQNCSQVLRYAVATGRAERNPGADLRGALPPVKPEHFASLTEPQPWASCCAPSRAMPAGRWCARRCVSRRECSCARVNCAPCTGPTWTSTRPSGASSPARRQRPTSCRCPGRRSPSCARSSR